MKIDMLTLVLIFTMLFYGVFGNVPLVIILLINVFFAIVYTFIYFKLLSYSPDSAWQMRKSEVAPDCELMDVEVRTKDGRKKVLWRVSPDSVDFTDLANEPVISFKIVKLDQ